MRSTDVLLVIIAGAFSVTSADPTDWLWQVTTDPADGRTPSWSPDGTTIAYTSYVGANGDIWTFSATGGTATRITTDPAYDGTPTWSPDGTTLAFSSDRSGNLDIWTISATGGTRVQVTTDPGIDTSPSWSPDGFAISFESDRSGNEDIWAIKPDYESVAAASLGEIKATFK